MTAPPLRAFWLACAALCLAPGTSAAQSFEVGCPTGIELEVAELINEERDARGLAPISIDVRLTAAAQRHADDMQAGCFLSHTGSDGSAHWQRVGDTGYPSAWMGEVAGAGHRSAREIVDGWIASSGHYAILMNASARHIGVGHNHQDVACNLRNHNFPVRDFWVANLAGHASVAQDPELHCGEGGVPACSDGLDNDGDGFADHGHDTFGCSSPDDISELEECSDGLDNDGDGFTDFPEDPKCEEAIDFTESCGIGFEVAPLLVAISALRGRLRRRRRERVRAQGSARTPRS